MISIFRRRWNLFGKVLLKLTTLNTGVLLFVFIVYNVLLYMIISNQLYQNVDNGMRGIITGVSQAAYRVDGLPHGRPFKLMVPPLPPPDDPRIVILFINAEGELVTPYPNISLKTEDIIKLAEAAVTGDPENHEYDGRHYRYIKTAYTGELLPHIGVAHQLVRVKDMIVIANVDPEIKLLHTFMIVSTTGTLLVFLIIVGAGYFLAQKALIPINQSWEKQERFVADASHEMRTPLAVIQSHAELLLHSPDHTIEHESTRIASIIKETTRMSNLVAKLLMLARSDSNQVEIEFQSINLRELVADVVTQFQPFAELKKINLSLQAGKLVDVMGDKERIAQLLVILLDNAIKYTPEGGNVLVRVNKKYHAAEIIVNDTGIGISSEDLAHIFDRFYRADKSRSGKGRGAGLGLAIAKWIVEKHAGSISTESIVGTGTKMVVTLPLKRYFF
jgi:two-component system, OmpR family, sensor histidine kinase CiaH